MPEVIHCRVCGQSFRVKNFEEGMAKLRSHRKRMHPTAFKRSVKQGIATRKARR